ncbi:galactose-3-O-sulfotransferase 3-like [Branchiostoma floridae x Branchiostoma belcheri]
MVLMPVGQGPLSWPFPPKENEYVHMPEEKYDALIHHLVYNKTWLLSKFPPETKYLSIIRQPFSHLKSQMNYFHLAKLMKINGRSQGNPVKLFLQDPWQHRNRSETFFPHVNITWDGTRNPMTFDMGWPAERADEEEEARKYISKLDEDFTLVMILEHLDESAVLLKRLMCWELRDVLYYNKNKNSRPYRYKKYLGTPEELENHRAWSAVDYMLYNTFNNSLWRKIKQQGPDFYDELKHFRRIKNDVSNFCNGTKKEHKNERQAMVVPASKWNPEFEVDRKFCWYIKRTRTMSLDQKIRGRRYTKKEMSYTVIDQIINYRLLAKGFPTFNNKHDANAAGIRRLRTKPKRVEMAHE